MGIFLPIEEESPRTNEATFVPCFGTFDVLWPDREPARQCSFLRFVGRVDKESVFRRTGCGRRHGSEVTWQ